MDVASAAIQKSLQMIQNTASNMVMKKAMGQDAQAIAAVLDMQPAQQLQAAAGHMDIRV